MITVKEILVDLPMGVGEGHTKRFCGSPQCKLPRGLHMVKGSVFGPYVKTAIKWTSIKFCVVAIVLLEPLNSNSTLQTNSLFE